MKDKEYRFKKLKRELEIAKENREKSKKWRLNGEQKEYIEELGYRVEPYLYSFKTKEFKAIHDKPCIIKDIHYARKRGKWMMCKQLSVSEMKILQEYGIKFKPVAFIIYLK